MPWIKVWIHLVWSTKNRAHLTEEIRPKLFEHIRENARAKAIHVDLINGYTDHVHCLISLGSDQTIEKVVQLIKGESSFWMNRSKLSKFKFAWQDEYFAASVSDSAIADVRRYIAKQEDHHRGVSFQEEFEGFLARTGFMRIGG